MILTSDSETTTWNTGNAFDSRNFIVCIGHKTDGQPGEVVYDDFSSFKELYESASLGVFFNAKFDLHHYRKLGIDISTVPVWCCQVGEFLLSGQTLRFPSLEAAAVKYGLGHKIDIIKTEYWEKKINTDAIPRPVLSEYVIQDVALTYQVYLKQLEQFQQKPLMFKLFKLMCQDLLVLQEMEWNGLVYNKALCAQRSASITEEIYKLKLDLEEYLSI